jgi:hypothetical protein
MQPQQRETAPSLSWLWQSGISDVRFQANLPWLSFLRGPVDFSQRLTDRAARRIRATDSSANSVMKIDIKLRLVESQII